MNKISGEEGRGIGGDRGGDLIDYSAKPLSSSSTLLCCFGNVAFFAQAQPVCSSVTLRFARRKEASSSAKSAASDDATSNFANCRGLKFTYFFVARQARRIETTKGVLMIARAVIIQSERRIFASTFARARQSNKPNLGAYVRLIAHAFFSSGGMPL